MSVVALLQRVGEIHIDDLAKHFEVPTKTMREMLSTLNTTSFMPRNSEEQLPFYIDLDRVDDEDGIVCLDLDEGPLGVPRITATQSVALLTGLNYLRSIPDFQDISDVDELIDLLSSEQPGLNSIEIDAPAFDNDLSVLKRAILTNRQIECRYVNSKGEDSRRRIDPLLLLTSEGHWYLRGFCHKHMGVRTFRLDHMVEATLVDEPRTPQSLIEAAKLDDTAPIYNASASDTEVILELAPEAYQLAAMFTTLKEPTKVGEENVRVTIKLGYLPDLGPLVCRFGVHARVVSPPAAREVVKRYAEQALGEFSNWGETE